MKAPLSWLRDYVDITMPVDELADRLTLAGLEVSAIEVIGDWWDRGRIVVGEVLAVRSHPNADRLVLVDVAYGGDRTETCVTGAPNLFPYRGQVDTSLKVAFAMEGAEIYDGHQEGFIRSRLKATRIRGVPSRAMVCSEKELGLSEAHEGILILPDEAPVGMPLADYLGDTVLDLDVTPNLARCLSMTGVAREVAALTGIQLRYPVTAWETTGPPAEELVRIRIDDPDLCARYIGAVIQDVEIGPSPTWMQNRLRRAGMRPISNIVDITNYTMLEWGQPLHAFDLDKLVARAGGGRPTIIVRRAKQGETMTTLDGVRRVFDEDTLLICDTAGPIAVAGVMGGLDTEIDDQTTRILLESANFDLISVRRTTQSLKLPSEASLRFGRGIHPAMPEPAARRASELMRTLACGTVARGMVDAFPVRPRPVLIRLSTREVERCLGVELERQEVMEILQRLEFRCELLGDNHTIEVKVPEHRLDCQYPADLVEEVSRIYGYDRLPLTELADRLPPQRSNRELELEEKVRDILVGCGLQEIITYSLTHPTREAALSAASPTSEDSTDGHVTLANPITQDRMVMRRTLLASALETAASNLRFRDQVRFFEVGKVFWPTEGEDLPAEPLRLSLVMAGARNDRHWLTTEGPDLDFYDLKGVIDCLASRLHLVGVAYEPVTYPAFHTGASALMRVGETEIGVLGEVHPAVREAFGLPARRIAAAELDVTALLASVPPAWYMEPVSVYPAVLQDLAVVVDEAIAAADVRDVIERSGGFLLKEVRLFDVYRGDPVPRGKKSLAYALAFQAPDKTLRDKVVAKQVARVVDSLQRELGAELRA